MSAVESPWEALLLVAFSGLHPLAIQFFVTTLEYWRATQPGWPFYFPPKRAGAIVTHTMSTNSCNRNVIHLARLRRTSGLYIL